MEQSDRIIISGQLRKKGSRVSTWTDRYFVLKDHTIYYYLKSSDVEPKHALPLHANCVVSKIWPEVTKKRKQFVFKISWKVEDINGTADEGNTDRDIAVQREEDGNLDESSSSPRVGRNLARTKTRNLADGKDPAKESKDGSNIRKAATAAASGSMFGALTSGLGLMTGMLAVGIGSTPTNPPEGHSKQPTSENQKSLTLACDTYQDAENWVTTIESQILELSGHLKDRDGDRNRYRSAKHIPRPEVRLAMVEKWVTAAKWKLFATHEGIRILQPQNYIDNDIGFYESFFVTNDSSSSASNKNQQSLPCLRVNIPINASIADTFTCIMNFSQSMRSGVIKSIRTVQTLDNFTDIIHLKLEPVYLHPSWTAPRDFCLMRYWRDNSDGSYVICLDSATHDDCPLVPGYLRAEMHAAYVIVPPTNKVRSNPSGGAAYMDDEGECTECMLTFVAQMDCKGWIWRSFGYQKHFLQEIMLHVLDVRDALDTDRFLHVHFDPVFDAQSSKSSNDGGAGAGAKSGSQVAEEQGSVATIPPSILSPSMWSNADASTFKVRGGSYNQDKVKVSSGPALFKLIGIDLFEVPEATHNIAAHPNNRVYLANQRGEKSWVFVFNIMVPGPPFLSFVAYFLADKSKMYEDTPFGRIARPFFDGNDDEFRNNRFKLIPKIVDGNMIIKMAVKDTPTLLGNKLKQYYYKDEHYFELDFCRYEMMNAMVTSIMNYSIDVGSSSVARNVVGLAMGYSKNIVVDMGLCLQGNDENELPEVLMGTCSCIHVDASTAKKL